uniref:Uncharacterized protein n=1 Tax=viral metagenome TaxID=1070528 RepID=A0A6M3KAX7_9ZZZZ
MSLSTHLNKTLTLKRRTQSLSGGLATKTYATAAEVKGRIYQLSGERQFESGVPVDVNAYILDTISSEPKVGDIVVDGEYRYEIANRYAVQTRKKVHHYKYSIKLTKAGV